MISEIHQKWLESRKINLSAAIHTGCYSAKRGEDGQVSPHSEGDIFVLPFIKKGEIVGRKYRGRGKKFWQDANGRKQFWNVDVLEDPELHDGNRALVIVEGEMDALAVMSAGYPWVVSVPDGAPPPRDGDGNLIIVPDGTDDIDPATDGKFNYLLSDFDLLSKVRKIIVACDSDEAGGRLSAELVRRLDRIRCSFVTYPETCKDFNDVLVAFGDRGVLEIIQNAKPFPVDGLFRFADFPPEEPIKTVSTGWRSLDDILKPYLGAFMVIGGFPGHGKSTWTMQFAANMAKQNGWPVAMASFEMRVVPYVTNALMASYIGGSIQYAAPKSLQAARDFVQEYFTFISPQRSVDDIDYDIDWLLDKMQVAVIRNGVKMVIIDPFNEIEHKKKHDESLTEYIGRAIRKLKAFAMQFQVLVVVVVHPTKAASHLGSQELSLYNLADSSHWANKADIGVIVGRVGDPQIETTTGVYVKKIRYQPDAGIIGEGLLTFDKSTRLFY